MAPVTLWLIDDRARAWIYARQRWSESFIARANSVCVGLEKPDVGKTALLQTQALWMPWTLRSVSTTPREGEASIRIPPMWWKLSSQRAIRASSCSKFVCGTISATPARDFAAIAAKRRIERSSSWEIFHVCRVR